MRPTPRARSDAPRARKLRRVQHKRRSTRAGDQSARLWIHRVDDLMASSGALTWHFTLRPIHIPGKSRLARQGSLGELSVERKSKTPSGNSTRGVSPSSYDHSIGTQRLEVKITLRSSPVPNSSPDSLPKKGNAVDPTGFEPAPYSLTG